MHAECSFVVAARAACAGAAPSKRNQSACGMLSLVLAARAAALAEPSNSTSAPALAGAPYKLPAEIPASGVGPFGGSTYLGFGKPGCPGTCHRMPSTASLPLPTCRPTEPMLL